MHKAFKNSLMYIFFVCIISSSTLLYSVSAEDTDSEITLVYSEGFESGYTSDQNLIPAAVDTADATSTTAKQVVIYSEANKPQLMLKGMNASALSTDNVVMVVDGSGVGRIGKVLKIQEDPKPEGNSTGKRGNVMVTKLPDTGSGYPLVTGKKLYLKMSIYIDEASISNLNTTTDYYGGYMIVPANTAQYLSRSGAVTSIDGTGYLRGASTIGSVYVPKDKWFDIEYVLDPANSTFDLFIDNTAVKKGQKTNAMTAFWGITAGLFGAGGDLSPTIYLDDLQAYYIDSIKPQLNITASDVDAKQTIEMTFPGNVSKKFIDYVSKNVVIKDSDGVDVPIAAFARENTVSISANSDFRYGNIEYTLNIPSYNLSDSDFYRRNFDNYSFSFVTKKAKGVYVNSLHIDTTDLAQASSVTIDILIKEAEPSRLISAAYGENNELLGYSDVQITSSDSSKRVMITPVKTGIKYIRSFIVNDEITEVYDCGLIYPETYQIDETIYSQADSQPKMAVVDAGESIFSLKGNVGITRNNLYALAVLVPSEHDQQTVLSQNSTIQLLKIDINGNYTITFKANLDSGEYKMLVFTDKVTASTLFQYTAIKDIIEMIKSVSVTNKSDVSYIVTEDLFDTVSNYADGIGMNTSDYSTDRDINLFNYRLNLSRTSLTGNTDKEIITVFSQIISKVKGEIDFLKKLEGVSYWSEVESVLKDNIEFTNIDFTKYTNVSTVTYNKFMGKTFASGDAVKEFFESNVVLKTSGGNLSSLGTSSSRSRTYYVPNVMVETKTNDVTDNHVNDAVAFADLDEFGWAKDAVTYLKNLKIVGNGENLFNGNGSVSRAEFVKMLVLALQSYQWDATCHFSDVDKNGWSYGYIASATQNGYINGVDDKSFLPDKSITRQDMAVILSRALKDYITFGDGDSAQFGDYEAVSEYAKDAVIQCCKMGILKGNEKNEFLPIKDTTRAEAAVVIYNVIKLIKG